MDRAEMVGLLYGYTVIVPADFASEERPRLSFATILKVLLPDEVNFPPVYDNEEPDCVVEYPPLIVKLLTVEPYEPLAEAVTFALEYPVTYSPHPAMTLLALLSMVMPTEPTA